MGHKYSTSPSFWKLYTNTRVGDRTEEMKQVLGQYLENCGRRSRTKTWWQITPVWIKIYKGCKTFHDVSSPVASLWTEERNHLPTCVWTDQQEQKIYYRNPDYSCLQTLDDIFCVISFPHMWISSASTVWLNLLHPDDAWSSLNTYRANL